MNIKRFFAKNSREALSQVRLSLGEEAVILSNRAVDGGTEILAVKEQDMDEMIIAQHSLQKPSANITLSSNNQKQIDILTRRNLVDEFAQQPLAIAEKPWQTLLLASQYLVNQ